MLMTLFVFCLIMAFFAMVGVLADESDASGVAFIGAVAVAALIAIVATLIKVGVIHP